MKGMLLAAGIGSRLKHLTDNQPKALVSLGNYTMLQLAVEYLKKYGVTEIIINVHHFADQIVSYVKQNNSFGIDIQFSDERAGLLNTGGGLLKAKDFFINSGDPFVLMAVDILTNLNLGNLIDEHTRKDNLVTLAVKDRDTSRSLLFDEKMGLCGWKHNQTGELKMVSGNAYSYSKGFSGIHVISPSLFSKVSETGGFSIVDLYLRLAATDKIGGFDHSADDWMEFGRVSSIENVQLNKDFNNLVAWLLS